jgi:hypothetical protein
VQTNEHISFLAKKETHSPEKARGNYYKSRGWIPKELTRIVGEGFLKKRVEPCIDYKGLLDVGIHD